MAHLPALFALTAFTLLLEPVARADVIVVDPPTGPDIQQAIDVAAPGDILLIKPSASDTGSEFTLDGKGLTLVADGDVVIQNLVIRNLPAGQHVSVHGLRFEDPTPSSGYEAMIEARDCDGSIWIDACVVNAPKQSPGGGPFGPAPAFDGLSAVRCDSLLITNSDLTGGDGANEDFLCFMGGTKAGRGGYGARVSASIVTLHGCTVLGGRGGAGDCEPGEDGGNGLLVTSNPNTHVAASTVTGGQGGFLGGAPSSGLRGVNLAPGSVTLRDTTVTSGAGLPPAPDFEVPAGVVITYAEPARTLTVSTPLREGESGTLSIDGQQGDLVGLFMAFTGGTLQLPGKQGVFSLGTPFFGVFLLGTIGDPSGQLDVPFVAGALTPPSLQGQAFLMQLVVHDGTQVLFEGNTAFVLLDSAIP